MTEIMPVPRNLILLSYQQRAFGLAHQYAEERSNHHLGIQGGTRSRAATWLPPTCSKSVVCRWLFDTMEMKVKIMYRAVEATIAKGFGGKRTTKTRKSGC